MITQNQQGIHLKIQNIGNGSSNRTYRTLKKKRYVSAIIVKCEELILIKIFIKLQPDDDEGGNNQPPKQMAEAKAPDDGKDNDDDLDDDLFNGLNPDDGLGLGLDDL